MQRLSSTSLQADPSWLRQPLLQLKQRLILWQRNARTRRQLAALDARQLADIGISPSERRAELDKPFWH